MKIIVIPDGKEKKLPKTSSEVKTRTQPSRPRTLKKSEAKAKDRVSEDRLPRGQGQKGSRPSPKTRGYV